MEVRIQKRKCVVNEGIRFIACPFDFLMSFTIMLTITGEKLLESSGGEDKKETMPQISYRITFRILRKQITPQAF